MCANEGEGFLEPVVTASFPSPAQDFYFGPVSLDRHLIAHPASTFILRVEEGAATATLGIHPGDELLVDRALSPHRGAVLVATVDDELRVGRCEVRSGRAVLVTGVEDLPLTAAIEPWGVVTVVIHHVLPSRRGESVDG